MRKLRRLITTKSSPLPILVLAISLCLFLIPSLSQAQLKANPEEFNFGTIREGINVPVKFILTNSGSRKIYLKEIRTFASCVQRSPLNQKSLAPGESLELNYIFESLGYGGAVIEKEIQIFFEGPNSPLKIKIKGKILPLESYQAPLGEVLYNFSVLIDLRPTSVYQQEHILGAINIPANRILNWAKRWSSRITNDMVIYLYDDDGQLSDRIAQKLRAQGYRQYVSLVGGIKEWKNQYGQKGIVGR
ncbi:MAG: hypothetical protein DRJ11_09830 [Candidatus Aminicenantes bacterium]|nr:MAG: hypothetical protein DRJ11_09830 [Candidatus Aminicenantes bacterium]HHF42298.1 DUF1573 domain-containing protein [Candidatus Aminicenantes bacterium]